jgi:hypothetical protein
MQTEHATTILQRCKKALNYLSCKFNKLIAMNNSRMYQTMHYITMFKDLQLKY